MVKNLENLCLEKVIKNLSLNYRILKKLDLKLSKKVCEKIYKNSFTILSKFNYDELKIFYEDVMELKNIDLSKKQFENIEYFDFLNRHKLDNLYINGIEKFKLSSENFSMETNNFHFVYSYLGHPCKL